jgi:hypothetical protein
MVPAEETTAVAIGVRVPVRVLKKGKVISTMRSIEDYWEAVGAFNFVLHRCNRCGHYHVYPGQREVHGCVQGDITPEQWVYNIVMQASRELVQTDLQWAGLLC